MADTPVDYFKSSGGRRPRIVFVNRFYHPDVSATSQMLFDLTQRLAAEGLFEYAIDLYLDGLKLDPGK